MPNTKLTIKGKLLDSPATITLNSKKEFTEGEVVTNGIDLGNAANGILSKLGGDPLFDKKSLVVNTDVKIYIQNKDQAPTTPPSKRVSVQANINNFPLSYNSSTGIQTTDASASGFFVTFTLKELLKTIPNVDVSFIEGAISLGFTNGKGNVSQVSSDGTSKTFTTKKGLYFNGEIKIAGKTMQLAPMYPKGKKGSTSGDNEEGTDADSGANTTSSTKSIKWVDLNQLKIGPITIRSLGFQLDGNHFNVLLKADISIGQSLSLSLIGMGVSIDMSKLFSGNNNAFGFLLYGLGLAIDKGSLKISGLFEKNPEKAESYQGGVSVKTETFTISGFGAYAKLNGFKSLFGFVYLKTDLGGPPSFFVQGLAFCFGYNRVMKMPSIDNVADFPLVKYAMKPNMVPQGLLKGADSNPLETFGNALGKYIPPQRDNFFMGVGVQFLTYGIVKSFVLLSANVGKSLTFDMLGISRLSLPPEDPYNPYVSIEIAIKARYSPEKGTLKINGILTENSYVLTPSLPLNGGFAFYSWFKDQTNGAKAGDFVITAGGYASDFDKPSYYPEASPIGFSWSVGGGLDVHGSLYFALTPSFAMFGGSWGASWSGGGLDASFTLSEDYIVKLKPFHYSAKFHVSIEAGFHVHVFIFSGHVSVSVGADMKVWGPDFSGYAELSVGSHGIDFHFKIHFGSGSKGSSKLSWDEFKSAFLPKKDKIITIHPMKGFINQKELSKQEKGVAPKEWLMNAKELQIGISSAIPIKPDNFYLPASNLLSATSTPTISLKLNGNKVDLNKYLKWSTTSKNVARVVWNDERQLPDTYDSTTVSMPMGIVLTPVKECVHEIIIEIPEKNFNYDIDNHFIDTPQLFIEELMDMSVYPPQDFKALTKEAFTQQEIF